MEYKVTMEAIYDGLKNEYDDVTISGNIIKLGNYIVFEDDTDIIVQRHKDNKMVQVNILKKYIVNDVQLGIEIEHSLRQVSE